MKTSKKNNSVRKIKRKENPQKEKIKKEQKIIDATDDTIDSQEPFMQTAEEKITSDSLNLDPNDPLPNNEDLIDIESELTPDDLIALGGIDQDMDEGEDERIRRTPFDVSEEELDVPGADLDDLSENAGSEDEENNSYSLGGDKYD